MRVRAFTWCCVAALWVGCGAKGAATKPDGSGESTASGGSEGAPSASGPKKDGPREVKFASATPRAVTLVDFVQNRVALGFMDGAVALFDPKTREKKESKVAKVFEVAAIAPSGDLALLRANPPVIVNIEGELILQMNTVPEFESAAFGPEGLGLYVADRAGKVRIWGQAHSFEEDQHKEKLENYLNRQAPDFHVEFAPIRGPIDVTDSNQIVVGDAEGIVRLWDPTSPSNSTRVMKLGSPIRSIATAEGHIYATSTSGALKIGKADGGYLPWTKDARGGFVAANRLATGMYWQLDDGVVAARKTEDGQAMWETSLPTGHLCGLAVSNDANWLAACVGNFVVLLDANGGAIQGYMYRDADGFFWKEA